MSGSNTAAIALERGIPANLDAERFILGSFLLQGAEAVERFGTALRPDHFALEKHRRIWQRILDLHGRREPVDRVTVANELLRYAELESVDGLSYLISLDDGLPQISSLDSYVEILIEKAALRRLATVAQNAMNRALTAEEQAEDIIASTRAALDGIETRREVASWKDLEASVAAHGGTFEDFISPTRSASARAGIKTPWEVVNNCLGSIQPGDLFLLAARPGMGKSGAAIQIARRAAHDGYCVAYLSLEMSAAAIERRLLAQIGNIDSFQMRSGYLTAIERDTVRAARAARIQLPILINDKGCRTAPAIVSAIRELRAKKPVGLVIIDHFHLVRGLSVREDERVRYSRIADEFQTAAREMGIPFVVLCQLSRRCEEENRAPGLSDLKETGKLEENADVVMFIHRPEMYAKNRGREELRGRAEFIVAKQRDGATGKCSMVFIGAQLRFEMAGDNQWQS